MPVRVVLGVVLAVLVASSGAFLVAPSAEEDASPVAFGETIQLGLTGVDVMTAESRNDRIPRAQVFYSQYEYVVGYYGLSSLASALDREHHQRQFGEPVAIYVTDFTGTNPHLTEKGYVRTTLGAATGWIPAEDAYFVVGSGARTPGGPATLPFESQSAAERFAAQFGGEVVDWATARARLAGAEDETRAYWNETVRARNAWADRAVEDARDLCERPVSVVVGEDAPTVQAAVERAPPNTTVRIPPGTYDANVTVRKPVTLRGAGNDTHLRGDDDGTVIRVSAPETAVVDLRISGVGPNGSRQSVPAGQENGSWDQRVRAAYGYGDTAIAVHRANGTLVSGVHVDTPSNGVLVRWSDDVVVTNTTVDGTDTWQEGFMSVVAMYSKMVLQDSTFHGGRDGVYTHRADGVVVRDNRMDGMRFGVHLMYTSDALVADNRVRDTDVGVIVMTRPTSNAVVGNAVRESEGGVSAVGSASYVAENVVASNDVGLFVNAKRSVYERNTVVGNEIGVRVDTIVPTNAFAGNDVVGNDEQVAGGHGPARIWSRDGRGNYWGDLPLSDRDDDGVYDRAYRPTDSIDAELATEPGVSTLARSPAVTFLRRFQSTVPGLRAANVIDESPLVDPVRPVVLSEYTNATTPPQNGETAT